MSYNLLPLAGVASLQSNKTGTKSLDSRLNYLAELRFRRFI
jgi:hypothetical protein